MRSCTETTSVRPGYSAAGQTNRFEQVRKQTEELAARLSAEDQSIQSMPDASPTKWHRAHTTWFFETFLLVAHQEGYEVFDETFAYLFNSYYEAAGPRHARAARGMLSRPGVEEVAAYRSHVDEAVREFIAAGICDGAADLLELGLQHEMQHQELLLMDIKHMLSQHPFTPGYRQREHMVTLGANPMDWNPFSGGIVRIGHDGDGFAFDNEGPAHEALVQDFEIGSRLITAGEWLDFMADGGYSEPRHWLSEGWATVTSESWKAPGYWQEVGGKWHVFSLDGLRPVDPAEPVCHVSMFEADAYATWAGVRLPTEFEWEVAANTVRLDGNLLEQDGLHPAPATKGDGVQQMFGDVWEWTASAYLAYPGFAPLEGAVGEYNGKFMSNQSVLRGGSCLTPSGHIRSTYRNFFGARSRWAMSGVRLARDSKSGVRPSASTVQPPG